MSGLTEGATHGLAFASGLAAETCIISTLRPGDHIVASDDLYGGTYRLFERIARPMGIETTYVSPRESGGFAKAITDQTKYVWLETPTNPMLTLVDIEAVAARWPINIMRWSWSTTRSLRHTCRVRWSWRGCRRT